MKAFPLFFSGVLIFCYCLSGCGGDKKRRLRTEMVNVDSIEQLVMIRDSLVKPFIYTKVSGLEKYHNKEVKEKFISLVLPSILVAKYHIDARRDSIHELQQKEHWSRSDSSFYKDLINHYKVGNLNDLILKLRTVPTSIAIAQAVVETGWGRSRFFIEGNNLFGIWSVKNNEPRIAATKTRNYQVIYVKTYPDMLKSAIDYFEMLSHSRAYKGLRKELLQTSDPFILLPHLKLYSEQRIGYTKKLEQIILQNNLTRFDRYQIDPQYFY